MKSRFCGHLHKLEITAGEPLKFGGRLPKFKGHALPPKSWIEGLFGEESLKGAWVGYLKDKASMGAIWGRAWVWCLSVEATGGLFFLSQIRKVDATLESGINNPEHLQVEITSLYNNGYRCT
jgi:hypothetical protein